MKKVHRVFNLVHKACNKEFVTSDMSLEGMVVFYLGEALSLARKPALYVVNWCWCS